MKWITRFFTISYVVYRFGLVDLVRHNKHCKGFLAFIVYFIPRSAKSKKLPLPMRVRLSLESLGPVFVKFGQVLSTRRDLLSDDYAEELVKLQDKVPPFSGELAKQIIEKSLKSSIDEVYVDFNPEPVASASVAQVHQAYLKQQDGTRGEKVAIKVLRPNILSVIEQDLSLMRILAFIVSKLFYDGRRLRPREVVDEFDKYLHDELDLMHEAANASQIGRQFAQSTMLIIPKVHYELTTKEVLTLQWMEGTPISDIQNLVQKGIDLKKLAVMGVEIFFTQVFQNGFFHADMHPGNIFIADDGRYIALDFGIVGSLTDYDKRYLAINFLAFFNRDYHRVATAHIESGWVPEGTRAEELEAAVRTVCEPIFNKPLSEISFGLVLMRLFDVSRRFNIEVQPQLVLLQKTLLNIEGLGRQLDPDLDLWATAKPFLVKWTNEQIGLKGFWQNLKREAPDWAKILPSLPRKVNQLFDDQKHQNLIEGYKILLHTQKRQTFWLGFISIMLFLLLIKQIFQF
ncbi:ubiquinone biosynthesis regulatory protein kinase UbiB [Neisseria sp. Ec49-e6-T10]|uniref:ubiquinone biosynthesis regulatory protein kinase UbiB n=1 Tax=Neisseria sp. Ec49-e6-T10 TaxID=3140744 RepID=UPI003EBF7A1A